MSFRFGPNVSTQMKATVIGFCSVECARASGVGGKWSLACGDASDDQSPLNQCANAHDSRAIESMLTEQSENFPTSISEMAWIISESAIAQPSNAYALADAIQSCLPRRAPLGLRWSIRRGRRDAKQPKDVGYSLMNRVQLVAL